LLVVTYSGCGCASNVERLVEWLCQGVRWNHHYTLAATNHGQVRVHVSAAAAVVIVVASDVSGAVADDHVSVARNRLAAADARPPFRVDEALVLVHTECRPERHVLFACGGGQQNASHCSPRFHSNRLLVDIDVGHALAARVCEQVQRVLETLGNRVQRATLARNEWLESVLRACTRQYASWHGPVLRCEAPLVVRTCINGSNATGLLVIRYVRWQQCSSAHRWCTAPLTNATRTSSINKHIIGIVLLLIAI
jgi:hypothetical protein